MRLEKLTLLRDHSQESVKASELLHSKEVAKLLKERKIIFREIYSTSSRVTPSLISTKAAYSYRGYEGVLEYVSSLNPTQ
jgi:hypothetical protein